jgi:ribosomal protein S1
MTWPDEIRACFPDWGTAGAAARWPAVRDGLQVGQTVRGTVIARAPFGVWLDIGVSFPALLLVPHMRGAKLRRITFEEYPPLGADVEGRLYVLGERGEIGVTQERPEEDPWRDPSQFAIGKEFVSAVVRVMSYGCFVELMPGVWGLLLPQRSVGRLAEGDRIRVRVDSVNPEERKIEVSQVAQGVTEPSTSLTRNGMQP